jgi:hypothetical protein
MALLPIDQLMKKLTVDELKTTAFSVLTSLGFPVTSWQAAAVIRTLVVLFCRLLAPFTDAMVLVTASGFLDYATGVMLEVVAEQVYGVTKRKATFATGELTLNNSGGGLYTFQPFQGRFLNPTNKKLYTNTTLQTLNPLQVGLTFPIQALEVGSASSSAAAMISQLEPPLPGVTCTNAAAVIGIDDETDPELRVRCRAKLGSLSPNGPTAAYEYVAKTFELNGGVVVTRTLPIEDSDTGDVTLYIAGPTGPISAPDVAKVQNAIDKLAVPLCIDCTVLSAVAHPLNVTSTVYVYTSANLTNANVQTLVDERLVGYVPTIPIGGNKIPPTAGVHVNALEGEIKASGSTTDQRGPIYQAVVTLPAADEVLAQNEVVTLGTVTTNVVQVLPPGAT